MTEEKTSIGTKIIGILVLVYLFILFIADRLIHVLLFHKTHERIGLWAMNKDNKRNALARVFIFAIPIIIYKLIF
jgi:hypothetical protein